MTESLLSLVGLFVAAFGAATLLPFQSEVVFVGLQLRGVAAPWLLVLVASVGNTLGSVLNWAIGRGIERFRGRRWFPVTDAQLAKAQDWYVRWGLWSLLVSWAPFGDAVTVVAGVMRCPLWVFVTIVGAVKTARYVLLLWGVGLL
ncbi:DedA family protein [Rhodobacteraceae bacterium 2CG4]|uniref:DedA family protein n=1 Tax=Halovulum marinum TaxID=2662447 RepID=A0A6L5YVT3_9RHOB|nr:YqaA family protein [Halovulum marinum]MSU88160.1 DedA family protein [Halovulum marinum]